ncbi:MAG: hypothetical protein ACRDSE_23375 [Pseudonocardiaceae bacterium]
MRTRFSELVGCQLRCSPREIMSSNSHASWQMASGRRGTGPDQLSTAQLVSVIVTSLTGDRDSRASALTAVRRLRPAVVLDIGPSDSTCTPNPSVLQEAVLGAGAVVGIGAAVHARTTLPAELFVG